MDQAPTFMPTGSLHGHLTGHNYTAGALIQNPSLAGYNSL